IAEALLSNTGGTATLVGDPPNILIASAAGFTFVDFLTHSLPVVLFTWLAALWLLRHLFRHELAVQPPNAGVVLQLNPRETLDDPVTTRKVLIILGVAIVFFFFEDALKISPAFIALSAAAGALLWIRPDMQDILKRIEWSVLVFFASLFVIVGGLEASGVLGYIVSQLELLKSIPPVLFGLILLWFSAGLSAFVDNVPITIALIPVLQSLEAYGFNIQPLWWALAFGAGFGGNGTIIGSSANIVVASLSERTRSPITPRLWNRRGLPVMLLTCTVASILYLLLFPLFQR
ncbi:MAG TPA: SLC13 family permease, partial [Anaerolineaceae bacterium]|nr:SLC13 family permease [Anaerolineaceae bacterium]